MNHLVYELERLIATYRDQPHVEIELRLGWHRSNQFDTDIGKTYYDMIYQTLRNSTMPWNEQVTHVHTNRTMRMITDAQHRVLDVHKKVKLEVVDFLLHGTPFDLRMSVCAELPIKGPFHKEHFQFLRSRARSTWRHHEWTYDLTCVTRNAPVDECAETMCVYELELELNLSDARPSTPPGLLAQSGVMKLFDMLCVNPSDQAVVTKIELNRKEKNHLKKKELSSIKPPDTRQNGIQQQRYSLQAF